jgi:SAM-dependent methyltransferase
MAAKDVEEAAKKLAALKIADKNADQKKESGDVDCSKLWETISAGRSLPTTYKPTLDTLIAEKDATLLQAVRLYAKASELPDLKDAVDGCVVDRLYRKWNAVFTDCSTSIAKSISQAEKKDKNLTGLSSLVYGEVLFTSLARVICKYVPLKPGMTFYDVGSGSGRGVFLSTLLHDFKRCSGIEILNGLYTASTEVLKKYNSEFAPKDAKGQITGPEVTLHHSDFRLIDFSDADLIFANSTCFDEQLMNDLARACERLKQGAFVITLTKGLNSTHFQVMESKQYPMSWGMATAITQKKILPPAQPETTTTDATAPK